jgi:hypothetical protein
MMSQKLCELSLTLANLSGARESVSCRVSRYGREFCYCLGLAVTGKKLTRPIFCAFNHRNPFNFLAKVELRGGEIADPNLRHPPAPHFFAIVVSDSPPLPGGSSQVHGGSIMSDLLAGLPPRFLRTPEAARFLGLSGRTLEKHRTYGTGPKYRKIGGRVVYALDDLKA